MTFRVGQKVSCIAGPVNSLQHEEVSAEVGGIYTVRAMKVWRGRLGLHLEEIRNPEMLCESGFHERYQMAERFRPIVERKTDISIFTAMLTPQGVDA